MAGDTCHFEEQAAQERPKRAFANATDLLVGLGVDALEIVRDFGGCCTNGVRHAKVVREDDAGNPRDRPRAVHNDAAAAHQNQRSGIRFGLHHVGVGVDQVRHCIDASLEEQVKRIEAVWSTFNGMEIQASAGCWGPMRVSGPIGCHA